jgi:hypothetical protein
MGKKRQRSKQTSKGTTHQNPNRLGNRMMKQQRLEYKGTIAHSIKQRKAWARGKRVMLTIANPNTAETNKPWIRVPANEVWGDWRYANKVKI